MRGFRIAVVALTLVACDEAKNEEASAPADTGQAAAPEEKKEVSGLEAGLAEVVKAKRAGEDTARREKCLALEPKLAEAQEAAKSDPKVQKLASQIVSFCPEATQTRRFMTKAAEPKPHLPKLSPALKKIFTAKNLKKTLAKAKKAAKRKQDPKEHCDSAVVTAKYLESKKRMARKTRKLVKRTYAYCHGAGALASVRFQLRAAVAAKKDEKPVELSEHCTAAVATLVEARGGKKRDRLEARAKELCLEAYAMKAMLEKAHKGAS